MNIATAKINMYSQISGEVSCPNCGKKLLIGAVSFDDRTEAFFCTDCAFRAAIPIIILDTGEK